MPDLSPNSPPQLSPPPRLDMGLERRSFRDYYIIIRERIWLSLPLALLVALSAGYYLARETPMYSATATMQFKRPERVVLNEQVVDQSVRSDMDLNTHLQTLNSGLLRTRVLESLTPEEIGILQRSYLQDLPGGSSPPHVSAALGQIEISPVRGSLLIAITVRHRDAEAAALVANRYVDEFMAFVLEEMANPSLGAVDFLRAQAATAKQVAEEREKALQEYKQKHDLISLDESVNLINDRIRDINGRLSAARIERLDLETALSQVDDYGRSGRNLLEISFIADHGTVPGLKAQLEELLRQQSILGERYLERHPQMVDLINTIDKTREQLNKAVALAIADLQSKLEKARATEVTYTQELANAQENGFRLGQLSVEFESLVTEASSAKNHYFSLLNRLNETMTSKNLENIPLRPLDRAIAPAAPYSPDMRKIVRTCLALGLIVLLGLPIGLNFIDDRVKSSWDVESFIGGNLLGIIPDLAGVATDEKPTLVTTAKSNPGVESFLSVYSAAKIQSTLDYPKSILITSTIPGEGKTLITCNLAACFARHGKNTLVIDGDMRRPMLHHHFKLPNESGIIPWFQHGAQMRDDPLLDPLLGIIRLADNLYLLRSGGRTKTPTEILENPACGHLLESLKRRFDLILIDSPPLGAVADGLLLAERADEVIYVCRFNRALRKHVKLFIGRLKESKGLLLGVVLNGLTPRRIEYYSNYRYYRSYRKYYGAHT